MSDLHSTSVGLASIGLGRAGLSSVGTQYQLAFVIHSGSVVLRSVGLGSVGTRYQLVSEIQAPAHSTADGKDVEYWKTRSYEMQVPAQIALA